LPPNGSDDIHFVSGFLHVLVLVFFMLHFFDPSTGTALAA
jgi:hypothetical protein